MLAADDSHNGVMTTPQNINKNRRLQRSRDNRWVAGVLGGFADYFGWNANVLRLLFFISFILPGSQLLLYLIAWIIMPNE